MDFRHVLHVANISSCEEARTLLQAAGSQVVENRGVHCRRAGSAGAKTHADDVTEPRHDSRSPNSPAPLCPPLLAIFDRTAEGEGAEGPLQKVRELRNRTTEPASCETVNMDNSPSFLHNLPSTLNLNQT